MFTPSRPKSRLAPSPEEVKNSINSLKEASSKYKDDEYLSRAVKDIINVVKKQELYSQELLYDLKGVYY